MRVWIGRHYLLHAVACYANYCTLIGFFSLKIRRSHKQCLVLHTQQQGYGVLVDALISLLPFVAYLTEELLKPLCS